MDGLKIIHREIRKFMKSNTFLGYLIISDKTSLTYIQHLILERNDPASNIYYINDMDDLMHWPVTK